MPENTVPPPSTPQPSSPPPAGESQSRTWDMLCHLSALAGLIIPFGNLLGPLLVWQLKKREIPSVEAHGKSAINFQITVMIALIVGGGVAFALSFFCIGFLLIPVVIAIALCGIIFPIIAGIKANDGKEYGYPWSLKLIK
jgi:uncharacterized protein